MKRSLAALILVGLWSGTMAGSKETEYTNMWIAHIHGGEEVAQRIARDLGYTYKSRAEPFEDHYVFLRDDHPEVSKRSSAHLTTNLLDLDEVKWAEQQAVVQRSKRGIVPEMPAQVAKEEDLLNLRGGDYSYYNRPSGLSSGFEDYNSFSDSGSNGFGDSANNRFGNNANNRFGDSANNRFGNSANDRFGNSANNRFGNSDSYGYGNSASNGFGNSASSGFGNSASSGFGNSASSGFGSSDSDEALSQNAVIIPVSGTDSTEEVVNNVMSNIGSNKVGLIIICNNAISASTSSTLVSQLARSGRSDGGSSVSSLSSSTGSVPNRTINKYVRQFESIGFVGVGKVAIVFVKGNSGTATKLTNQADPQPVNSGFGNDNNGLESNSGFSSPNSGFSRPNSGFGRPNSGFGNSGFSRPNSGFSNDNNGLDDNNGFSNSGFGKTGQNDNNKFASTGFGSGGQSNNIGLGNGDSDIVYVTASRTDSDSNVANAINNALGVNNLGLLIICGSPISSTSTNSIISILRSAGKLGDNGMSIMRMSGSGAINVVGNKAITSSVNQYKSMGVVGNGNVAVVISEGKSNSYTDNQQSPATGNNNYNLGSGNTGSYQSPATSDNNNLGSDSGFDLSALTGGGSGYNQPSNNYGTGTQPSKTSNYGTGNQPSSGFLPSQNSASNSDTKPVNTASSGSGGEIPVIIVNVDQTNSLSDYVTEKLGDNRRVGAIILSGNSGDSTMMQEMINQLSLYDKVSYDGVSMMQLSTHDRKPVGAGSIFGTVNDLIAKGKLSKENVAVVLSQSGYIDENALKEMFEQADQGDLSKLGSFPTQPSNNAKQMLSTYEGPTKHIACVSEKHSAYENKFNDPLWSKQWYEQDYRTTDVPVMDHNVVPVYNMGITGEGVTVAVVDDGVMHNHPDLAANFIADLSYDMCLDKFGSEPNPPDAKGDNSHGTKCAGEIAMVANNGRCGVGIAYNAKVGGVKTLGVRVVEYGEAKGLVYKLKHYQIYSNSWGPNDDGLTLAPVGHMTHEAFKEGTTKGRDGLGVVYVFSAGNGRASEDNCALDGLINHLETIPITSVSQRGKTVHYSERCTAVFAGTYSGGNENDEAVATIDINGECTTTFSGTSAAAPIATGIIALVLQANPKLSYRDIMHLIAMSAEVAPVANNENIWYKNGRGLWVSNDFGFGLMNAENMVLLAQKWTNVKKRNTCVVAVNLETPQSFSVNDDGVINFQTDACQNKNKDSVFFLEQIELSSTIDYPFRGAISMKITSPAGTTSDILEKRIKDSDPDGYNEWSIKSVHNWGEDPKGKWKIVVKANPVPEIGYATGRIRGFTLLLHGTVEMPEHYRTPRKYAPFRLPDGRTSEV